MLSLWDISPINKFEIKITKTNCNFFTNCCIFSFLFSTHFSQIYLDHFSEIKLGKMHSNISPHLWVKVWAVKIFCCYEHFLFRHCKFSIFFLLSFLLEFGEFTLNLRKKTTSFSIWNLPKWRQKRNLAFQSLKFGNCLWDAHGKWKNNKKKRKNSIGTFH